MPDVSTTDCGRNTTGEVPPPLCDTGDTPQAAVWLTFLGLVLLAVVARLPGVGRPLVGNFATKNVVYAMIARNWAEGRTTWAYPMLDCVAERPAGNGCVRSLHMLELPVSAYLTGSLWRSFGGSLDVWGRATAVSFSGVAVGLLFLFVRRRHGHAAAVAAAAALALAPVSVIYGQSFMLEASLVFFTVATFHTLDRWLSVRSAPIHRVSSASEFSRPHECGHYERSAGARWPWLLATVLSLALLLLTKVYMVVVLLPLAVEVLRKRKADKRDRARWREGQEQADVAGTSPPLPLSPSPVPSSAAGPSPLVTLAALGLAVVPAVFWYYHAMIGVPTGPLADRVYYSVRQSVSAHAASHALLATPDFWRRMLDDLTGVVLTPIGFAIALAGLFDRRWRQHAAWLLAGLILMLALPRKFYEMNYYWMAVLPPLCVMAGLGWQVVKRQLKPGRTATVLLVLAVLVFSARYAAKPAFVTPDEDRGVVAAGRAVGRLARTDEPVVTMHGTTIDLLYYVNRPGWAVAPDAPDLDQRLDEFRRHGARYLAAAGPEATARCAASKTLTKIVQGDGFAVYGL